MRKKFVKNYFFDPKNWVADYLRVLQLIKSHKSDLKDSLANIDSISQQDCFSAEEKILLSSFKDHILKLVGAKSTTDFKYDYWRDSPIYKSGIKKFSSQQRNLRRKIINSLVVERAGRSNFDDLEKKKNMIIDRSFSKVREIWEILAGQDYFLAEPSELSSISSSENIDKLFKFLFSKKIKTPFFFALIVKIYLLQWAMEYYLCSSASQDNGVLSNFTQLLFKDERVICNPIYETWVVDFASKEFLVMENNDDNLVSLKRQGSFVAKVPLSQWNGWNFFFRSRRKSRV